MAVGHEVVVIPDDRFAVPGYCPAVDRRKLAEHVAGADGQAGLLAVILQVLGIEAQNGVRENAVLLSQDSRSLDRGVRADPGSRPDHDLGADDRVGADLDPLREPRLRTEDALHSRGRAALADTALQGDDLRLDPELISRQDRPAKLTAIHGGQVQKLLLVLGNDAEEADRGDLSHRFHDQHPRHDRIAGKMPLEEFFVEGHVLNPDHALSLLDLEDPVHQEKRVTVRKDLKDFGDSDFHGFSPSRTSPTVLSTCSRRRASSGSRATSAARLKNSRWGAPGIPETMAPGGTTPRLTTPPCAVTVAPSSTVAWSPIPAWPASV